MFIHVRSRAHTYTHTQNKWCNNAEIRFSRRTHVISVLQGESANEWVRDRERIIWPICHGRFWCVHKRKKNRNKILCYDHEMAFEIQFDQMAGWLVGFRTVSWPKSQKLKISNRISIYMWEICHQGACVCMRIERRKSPSLWRFRLIEMCVSISAIWFFFVLNSQFALRKLPSGSFSSIKKMHHGDS